MPLWEFGELAYDVDDIKIAVNNQDGTFGTLYDVPSCDLLTLVKKYKSATARGDGRVTARVSMVESADVTMRNFGIVQEIESVITGASQSSGGTTPNRYVDQKIGAGLSAPYWGLVGRSFDGNNLTSGFLCFIPYLKLMDNVEWRLEYNTISSPQVRAEAIGDPVLTDSAGRPLVMHVRWYETLPAITAMPLPAP